MHTHIELCKDMQKYWLSHDQAGTTTLPPNKLATFQLCGGGRTRLRLFFMSVCILSRLFLIGRQKLIFSFIFLQEIKWNDYYVDCLSKFRNQNSSESNHSVLLHTYLSLLAKVREWSWVKLRESERSWVEREVELWVFIFSFTNKVEVELRLATHFHPDVRQQRCYEPRMSPIQLSLLWLNALVLSWAGPICWARKWGPWKFWRRWHVSPHEKVGGAQ